ncbi:MAG: ABC transporter substrate-binding protein [Coprococcus sp.]
MKKVLALLCAAALSVGMLAGCGSSSGSQGAGTSGGDNGQSGEGGKVVMLACVPDVAEEQTAWEEVAAAFQEETGIEVELRFQGTWDEIPTLLQESRLAGDQVDIVRVGIGTISSTLGAAGGVKDLTELAAPLLDRYSEGMTDHCYIGDHLWALPYYDASSYMCLYNKTLFEEMGLQAPTTWDELLTVSQALSEKDGMMPMIFQGKDGWAWPMMYTETYNQATGNNAIAAVESFLKGETSFVSDASVQAFDLVKKFYDDQVLTTASLDTDEEGMIATFAQGKAGMLFAGTWDYETIKNSCDFEVGAFAFPVMVEGSHAENGYGVGDYALAVPSFASDDNLENTMRFLEYITRQENAQKILGTSTMIYEVLKGVSTEPDEVTDFLNSQIADNSAKYLDWIWPSEVNDALSTAIVASISGEMTSEEAAAYVQKAYDTVCEEQDYTYAWWESWTEEQWDNVTPAVVPDLSQYMK